MARLTVKRIEALQKPGRFGDGNCLYLVVAPGGSKSWVQRLVIDGRRRDIGLGSAQFVTLAQARDAAYENRRAARRGLDPLAGKRRKVLTFRQASERALEANRAQWRSVKTADNWISTMQQHVYPVFGDTPVDRIDGAAVLKVLSPIWTAKPELGRKVRTRLRTVFGWAMAHGLIEQNPAGEIVNAALPSLKATMTRHFRALPYADVASALAIVDASGASKVVKAAIRFVVLTAVRSGEARLARWAEIDLPGRVWRIPAERTKMGRPHAVPLSDAALAVLRRVEPLRDGSGLVFPSPSRPGQPMSDMTLTKALRDTGLAASCTVHGFRSSFRDWAAEKAPDVPFTVAESCLGHQSGSAVEKAYLRSDLFDQRRDLMDRWGAYLAS